jgi:hypothetical protein
MKKIALLLILFSFAFLLPKTEAQVKVSVNINVGTQPEWGPAGYDYVDYYFFPDIDVYYYVPQHQYIYLQGGRWLFAASLPDRCRHYDIYRGYKVVINEPRPYLHHDVYRERYVKYKGHYDEQPTLHDHGHGWKDKDDDDGQGNGHGKGHAYGHDKHHGDD